MAELDTTYYILTQKQLYTLLHDTVAQTYSYLEDGITHESAVNLAIGDVLAGMNTHARHNVPPIMPRFARLKYWRYRNKAKRNRHAALSFDDWLLAIQEQPR